MFLLRRFCGDRFGRINAIIDEHERMLTGYVNLVASASYPFPEVLQALSFPLSTFPTEGLVGRRYFPGSKVIDDVEQEAQRLIRTLFGLSEEYMATIQPHSGTQANQIVFNAVLKPEDSVLSLKPSHGGHISHTVLIGRRNKVVHYGLTATGKLDYDEIGRLVRLHRPRLVIAGSSSYAAEIDYERIAAVAREHGALVHADVSHTALFIAAGVHRGIFPAVDFATFNMSKNLRGPTGGVLVYRASLHGPIQGAVFPGTQGGPLENVLFAKMTALDLLTRMDVAGYAAAVVKNARILEGVLRVSGVPVASVTDTHIVLLDLRDLGISGHDGEQRLEAGRILANRNLVPDDPRPPHVASGVRLGSACITILGYEAADVRDLGLAVARLLRREPGQSEKVVSKLLQKYQSRISTASEGT